jgi:hypothetical protein
MTVSTAVQGTPFKLHRKFERKGMDRTSYFSAPSAENSTVGAYNKYVCTAIKNNPPLCKGNATIDDRREALSVVILYSTRSYRKPESVFGCCVLCDHAVRVGGPSTQQRTDRNGTPLFLILQILNLSTVATSN